MIRINLFLHRLCALCHFYIAAYTDSVSLSITDFIPVLHSRQMRLALKFVAFSAALAVFWRVTPFFGTRFPDGAIGGMLAVVLALAVASVAYVLFVAFLTKIILGRVQL
jgi:hypothetical protein